MSAEKTMLQKTFNTVAIHGAIGVGLAMFTPGLFEVAHSAVAGAGEVLRGGLEAATGINDLSFA